MTPEQTIKCHILNEAISNDDLIWHEDISVDNVDLVWEHFIESDLHWDYISDYRYGIETDLPSQYSRHYEAKEVANKFGDQWIGWTFWYGGGKYGEPESIDWMGSAYFLDCVEETKVVTVRVFSKVKQ
jgi:hypothetical protein